MAQQGVPLQPFCGAVIRMSTPVSCMSIQSVPEAMQSSTSRPFWSWMASASFRM